jgi:outer membrane biosynthesis protein TonB
MLRRTIGVLLFAVSSIAGAQTDRTQALPRLLGADLPRYPALAEAAHITGWLKIRVTVENGKVIRTDLIGAQTKGRGSDVVSTSGSPFLVNPTLENLKSWRFATDVSDSFVVTITYRFAGPETDQLTNPAVEVLPSLDVTITARPVKPIEMY